MKLYALKGIIMLSIPEFENAVKVFEYFEEISRIPHGSSNCSHIADYLVDFAKTHSLEFYRDSSDNVIIKKPAAAGYESRPTVIIQGHTDMVAEKDPSLDKDMTREGIEIYRDGDFLRAKGTTLGGDDGIAVAYALALLSSEDIPHPSIEALFTSDEEIGLLGATALDVSQLSGNIMINIDSDDEGIFTVGCAGGIRTDFRLPVLREAAELAKYRLTVCGLIGGHSGVEIDKGRANASKLGAEILSSLGKIFIFDFHGGNMDNAITREFTAEFCTERDISADFSKVRDKILSEWKCAERDISITLEECGKADMALDSESSAKLLELVNAIPSGVISMSNDIPELVESSMNLGIVRLSSDFASLTVSVRSSKGSEKLRLVGMLSELAAKYGADFSTRGDYPAWEYKNDSHLRDTAVKVYNEMYGKAPKVITIHAGLECGIFSDRMPALDCISLGPDNYDIHTTEEHLSVSSTARVWEFLRKLLKEI